MRINLPDRIEITCCQCQREFGVHTVDLGKKTSLNCPLCGKLIDVLSNMPPNLQRRVYFAIKQEIENSAMGSEPGKD